MKGCRPHLRYPREIVLAVYELKEQCPEMSNRAIARKLGLNDWSVSKWLREPFYDPYIDDYAVLRAVEGDRNAFEALTHWEKMEFYHRLALARKSMTRSEWCTHCHELAQLLGIEGSFLGDALYAHEGGWFTKDREIPARPSPRGRAAFHRNKSQLARKV